MGGRFVVVSLPNYFPENSHGTEDSSLKYGGHLQMTDFWPCKLNSWFPSLLLLDIIIQEMT